MITNNHRANTSLQGRGSGSHPLRRWTWVIVIMAALAMILAYKLLTGSREGQTPSGVSKVGSQVGKGKGSTGQQAAGHEGSSRSSTNEMQSTSAGAVNESTKGIARGAEAARVAPTDSRRAPPGANYARAQQLLSMLKQMKPRQGKFSPEEVKEINRLIQELKQQGPEGVMAVQEFLESGEDVSFMEFTGRTPPEYSSLRTALIDSLIEMSGPGGVDFLAWMLQGTTNPEEIAFLAKGLELSAPGIYRSEIMKVVRTMLDAALKSTPGQFQGYGHLLGVIQEYGDASTATELEKLYRNSPSARGEYALMALSKLPEGNGVPTLVGLANEMAKNPGAYGASYESALRMLTQASREYADAGEALVNLAAANSIPPSALMVVAAALGGTEQQLITKSSEVSKLSRAEVYINGRAAETWSDAEIDQRLGLIDKLLRTNPQPSVVKALEDARSRLQVWKGRPMVGGKRISQ